MLNRFFHRVDRLFSFVEDWSLFIAVCIALFTAMANVILRKATAEYNLYWSDEVVRKVIYFSTYIGCVTAVRCRSMITIDAIPQMFPSLRKPLAMLSHISVLLFSATMIYLGSSMTMMMYHDEYARTTTLQIPEFYFYAVLPLMGVMMFLRTLLAMREDWSISKSIRVETTDGE